MSLLYKVRGNKLHLPVLCEGLLLGRGAVEAASELGARAEDAADATSIRESLSVSYNERLPP